MALGLLIALAASIAIAYVIFRLTRKLIALLFNGIFGLVVFWLLGYFGMLKVPLDAITFLIAALGGVLGVVLVVVLSALGIPL